MPRLALIKLVKANPQLAKDEQRLKSMLADDCPKSEDRRYVHAIQAARSHVVAQMTGSHGLDPVDVLLPRLTHVLIDSTGLNDDLAGWAVSAWAEALGIATNWQPLVAKLPTNSPVQPTRAVQATSQVTKPLKSSVVKPCVGGKRDIQSPIEDIFEAVAKGTIQDVKYFAERSTNVNAKNKDGGTPLHVAAELGKNEIVKFFVALGTSANTSDKSGNTPLHCAVCCNSIYDIEIIDHLVFAGADVNAKNNYGETALGIAEANGNASVVTFLKNVGAK